MKGFLLILISIFLFACCGHSATEVPVEVPAQANACDSQLETIHEVYKSVGKLIVYDVDKETKTETIFRYGSAFAIGKNELLTAGHICRHLVDDPSRVFGLEYYDGFNMKFAETKLAIKIKSKFTDLCILSIEDNPLKPVAIATVWPQWGDKIFLVGYPSGELSILEGYLSRSQFMTVNNIGKFYATCMSIPVVGGASGSPILNTKGEFIGLFSAYNEFHHLTYMPAFLDVRRFVENNKDK